MDKFEKRVADTVKKYTEIHTPESIDAEIKPLFFGVLAVIMTLLVIIGLVLVIT